MDNLNAKFLEPATQEKLKQLQELCEQGAYSEKEYQIILAELAKFERKKKLDRIDNECKIGQYSKDERNRRYRIVKQLPVDLAGVDLDNLPTTKRNWTPVVMGAFAVFLLFIIFAAAINNAQNKIEQQAKSSTASTHQETTSPAAVTPTVPAADPANPFAGQLTTIIGADKATIQTMFSKWQYKDTYTKNVDPAALKYIGQGVMAIVYFNDAGKAEGVSFLSNPPNMGDPVTGAGSYVHQHYDQLIQWANGNQKNAAIPNVSTQYPVELYIGNCHE